MRQDGYAVSTYTPGFEAIVLRATAGQRGDLTSTPRMRLGHRQGAPAASPEPCDSYARVQWQMASHWSARDAQGSTVSPATSLPVDRAPGETSLRLDAVAHRKLISAAPQSA